MAKNSYAERETNNIDKGSGTVGKSRQSKRLEREGSSSPKGQSSDKRDQSAKSVLDTTGTSSATHSSEASIDKKASLTDTGSSSSNVDERSPIEAAKTSKGISLTAVDDEDRANALKSDIEQGKLTQTDNGLVGGYAGKSNEYERLSSQMVKDAQSGVPAHNVSTDPNARLSNDKDVKTVFGDNTNANASKFTTSNKEEVQAAQKRVEEQNAKIREQNANEQAKADAYNAKVQEAETALEEAKSKKPDMASYQSSQDELLSGLNVSSPNGAEKTSVLKKAVSFGSGLNMSSPNGAEKAVSFGSGLNVSSPNGAEKTPVLKKAVSFGSGLLGRLTGKSEATYDTNALKDSTALVKGLNAAASTSDLDERAEIEDSTANEATYEVLSASGHFAGKEEDVKAALSLSDDELKKVSVAKSTGDTNTVNGALANASKEVRDFYASTKLSAQDINDVISVRGQVKTAVHAQFVVRSNAMDKAYAARQSLSNEDEINARQRALDELKASPYEPKMAKEEEVQLAETTTEHPTTDFNTEQIEQNNSAYEEIVSEVPELRDNPVFNGFFTSLSMLDPGTDGYVEAAQGLERGYYDVCKNLDESKASNAPAVKVELGLKVIDKLNQCKALIKRYKADTVGADFDARVEEAASGKGSLSETMAAQRLKDNTSSSYSTDAMVAGEDETNKAYRAIAADTVRYAANLPEDKFKDAMRQISDKTGFSIDEAGHIGENMNAEIPRPKSKLTSAVAATINWSKSHIPGVKQINQANEWIGGKLKQGVEYIDKAFEPIASTDTGKRVVSLLSDVKNMATNVLSPGKVAESALHATQSVGSLIADIVTKPFEEVNSKVNSFSAKLDEWHAKGKAAITGQWQDGDVASMQTSLQTRRIRQTWAGASEMVAGACEYTLNPVLASGTFINGMLKLVGANKDMNDEAFNAMQDAIKQMNGYELERSPIEREGREKTALPQLEDKPSDTSSSSLETNAAEPSKGSLNGETNERDYSGWNEAIADLYKRNPEMSGRFASSL